MSAKDRLSTLLGAAAGVCMAAATYAAQSEETARPNILWVTCEDISPHLGCYGDPYAVTPNLDRLASQGIRYLNAFAPIGVSAPARSCLITGMYAPSLGTHHMRCRGNLPARVRPFPAYLRDAGYYCTNNSKEDYNFEKPPDTWDESSWVAHWRKRAEGQPFFAVFNLTVCHESQIRIPERGYEKRTASFTSRERHDPARAPVPPYHPDRPEVRRDWARYADMITVMDRQVGRLLDGLEQDGLAEDTIVFFFSDHGAGMPRSKRWLYDSSTRVPLMVRFPDRYRSLAPGEPGSETDRLVDFTDLAPTVLSLAGLEIPKHMQGKAFLGERAAEPRNYVYGFRDRMDERYDMLRAVRDKRYKYIRNYLPHRPYAQHISYMYQMPTMITWHRLFLAGGLAGPQKAFFEPKPAEELYDTRVDPHEIRNLAADPEFARTRERLSKGLDEWLLETRDLGFLPEAQLRTRFGDRPEYAAVRMVPDAYPLERLLAAACLATGRDPARLKELTSLLDENDAALRYWGAIGCAVLGERARKARAILQDYLADSDPTVRLAAAEALCRMGRTWEALPALIEGVNDPNEWVRLYAMILLDELDKEAGPALEAVRATEEDKGGYVKRVRDRLLEAF